MATLTITPEVDRALAAVMDAALKQGGWQMLGNIDAVRGAISAAELAAASKAATRPSYPDLAEGFAELGTGGMVT